MLDKDGDGSVTLEELTETLRRFADDDEIKEMIVVADQDGDGEISYKEFVRVFQHPAWCAALTLQPFPPYCRHTALTEQPPYPSHWPDKLRV